MQDNCRDKSCTRWSAFNQLFTDPPDYGVHRHPVESLAEHIQEGSGMAVRNSLAYQEWNDLEPEAGAVEGFHSTMMTLLDKHRPSRMPFFRRLAQLPKAVASDPQFLGEIHLIYQAAM